MKLIDKDAALAMIEELESQNNCGTDDFIESKRIAYKQVKDGVLEMQEIDSMQEEPKECMYSKDNYTDEDRKVLCGGCEEDCRFNKKEESVNNGIDLGCGVIWRDEEPVSEDLKKAAIEHGYKNGSYPEYSADTVRQAFISGYHQAEKDLELSWEDIKTIDKLLNQCVDYSNPYQEVLKRFKNLKERKEK